MTMPSADLSETATDRSAALQPTVAEHPEPSTTVPEPAQKAPSAPAHSAPAASAASPPRASSDLNLQQPRGELRLLLHSRVFWAGLLIKLFAAIFLGSHVATRWFAPFLHYFVGSHFSDPYQAFLSAGEPLAFPYGPGMLLLLTPPWLLSLVAPAALAINPAGWGGLLLLRLPSLAADIGICILIMRWLRQHATDVLAVYWLNPIVLYAAYVHGQLDLIPTFLLCLCVQLLFTRHLLAASLLFGLALATKLHLAIAAPFLAVYLVRARRPQADWARFLLVSAAVALALYFIPLRSPAFRAMVFASAEAKKVWAVTLGYGSAGLVLYLAPAALLIAFLRFASYRKVNQQLTLMYLGAVYVGLVALVPPQPGWYIWSLPFVAYLYAQFTRHGRFATILLAAAYLAYFFIHDAASFLEAVDPTLGAGTGQRWAQALSAAVPALLSQHAANIAWTVLFGTTILTALEMYQRGVQSNAIYRLRDESFMIGIGGDSGAGKHTIGADLARLLGPRITLLNGDDDHRWERGHLMWKRYTHLNPRGNQLLDQLEGLRNLRQGRQVRKRHYDHNNGRFTDPILIRPNEYMCIIGLHPFYLPAQRELFHLRVFVNPAESLRESWKVARDMGKRGYSRDQVLEQMQKRRPDSVKYVLPQMRHADVVIRHCAEDADDPLALDLELEMSGSLDPLALVEILERVPSLQVDWEPDEALTRDHIRIRGGVQASDMAALAEETIPHGDELLAENAWQAGGRGVVQFALMYALSARMRAQPSPT